MGAAGGASPEQWDVRDEATETACMSLIWRNLVTLEPSPQN